MDSARRFAPVVSGELHRALLSRLGDFTLAATRYQTLLEGEAASLLSVDIATGERIVLLEELVAVDFAAPSPTPTGANSPITAA